MAWCQIVANESGYYRYKMLVDTFRTLRRRKSGLILQFKKKLKFYVAGVSGHQGKDP